MGVPRVLIDLDDPPVVDTDLNLTGPPAHHLSRVLRIRPGDTVALFDGSGVEWTTRVGSCDGRSILLQVMSQDRPDRECPIAISLLQGLCRGERMDLVMQKATALGAAAITAVACHRSTVRLDGTRALKRLGHWRSVVVAAAEQSGRVRLPEVNGPIPMAQACTADAGLRLILDPAAGTRLVDAVETSSMDDGIALIVGPEGGLSDSELEASMRAGWLAVALGPRTLRTETAGMAALAAIQAVRGLL
jgi:16S rRNA (uracil1498-N3)-methyltransferase